MCIHFFLALSLLTKHKSSFKTEGARTGFARLERRKIGRNNHGNRKRSRQLKQGTRERNE
jgi:hypothetical protein